MLVKIMFLVGLFVAGQVFGDDGDRELEGWGTALNLDAQADYNWDWTTQPDSSPSGKFALTVQIGSKKLTMELSVNFSDDDLDMFTVAATAGDGRIRDVGQGNCYHSNHGPGNIYVLRYDQFIGLNGDKLRICEMKFQLPIGGLKFKLRKVFASDGDGGELLLIDGAATNATLDFELLTTFGRDALIECGTDSGVEYCFGGSY